MCGLFDGIYPRLAKEIGVLFYPFILDGVAMNPKLNQADGMHPNPAGVKIIVARMCPTVKQLVAKGRKTSMMFKRLLSVGGFTLLSRITGFVRDILMAAFWASGVLSDAFLFAFLFPNYFRAIFGEGTINPAFLPRYAALRAKGGQRRPRRSPIGCSPGRWRRSLCILMLAMVSMPLWWRLAPGSPAGAARARPRRWRASPFPI